jgi:hypothetical protein
MSETDSFISEVTEEVRRDRLFQAFRRYGWIGVLAVLLIVGGAAFNEWRKARAESAAQATGDALIAALRLPEDQRGPAIAALPDQGEAGVLMAFVKAAELQRDGDAAGAAALLDGLAADGALAPLYRDLAAFKAAVIRVDLVPPADRIAALEQLALPGAPFRHLAQEQIALAHLQAGETEAAIAVLTGILEDAESSGGARDRAQSLLIALGQDPGA